MIDLLERLNVRPEERRVAIYVFFGFFIVLNDCGHGGLLRAKPSGLS